MPQSRATQLKPDKKAPADMFIYIILVGFCISACLAGLTMISAPDFLGNVNDMSNYVIPVGIGR